MDWIQHLNKAIDYIEENLDGTISYQKIAKIAGCSVYNFQRVFSYITDKSLSEYIRSRRLTLAAFDILNSSDRIIDIAVKYGYESQDSFTRAFKSFHGILPSKVRPAGFIGMSIGGKQENSEEMDYIIGVTNHVEAEGCIHVPAPDGMDEIQVKSATWAVLEANGRLPDAVQNIYRQFYTEWLPNSGYQLEDLPIMECYMQEGRQEVWIAVKKE